MHVICLLTLVIQLFNYILYFGKVDYLKEPQKVEYDEVLALPIVRNWTRTKLFKIGYEGAKSFLYFLDKYVTVMVGGTRAMTKYYKINYGKTLLDRLSPLDIAYIVQCTDL